MPIEIRELVIKTTVRDEEHKAAPKNGTMEAPSQELISACVDKVMDLLKQKLER